MWYGLIVKRLIFNFIEIRGSLSSVMSISISAIIDFQKNPFFSHKKSYNDRQYTPGYLRYILWYS